MATFKCLQNTIKHRRDCASDKLFESIRVSVTYILLIMPCKEECIWF